MKTLCVTILFAGACGPVVDPVVKPLETQLQNATNAIDYGIVSITTQSDLWRAQLGGLADQLLRSGMVQAAAFVRNTMFDGIARVGVEYRCDADYTSRRIREGLQELKGALLRTGGDAVPPAAPRKGSHATRPLSRSTGRRRRVADIGGRPCARRAGEVTSSGRRLPPDRSSASLLRDNAVRS